MSEVKPIKLVRNVKNPQTQRAICHEDGVHFIKDGEEEKKASYPSIKKMNATLKEIGFDQFEIDTGQYDHYPHMRK